MKIANSDLKRLTEFFAEADIPVGVNARGSLIVNGHLVTTPYPAGDDAWGRWVDEIAVNVCGSHLLERTRSAVSGLSARVHRVAGRGIEVSIDRDGMTGAIVRATSASVYQGERISGNFLAEGQHWDRLVEDLRKSHPPSRHVFAPAAPTRRVRVTRVPLLAGGAPLLDLSFADLVTLDEPPAALSEEQLAEGMTASDRIRNERMFAFDLPVLLQVGGYSVRFDPLRRDKELQAAFEIDIGQKSQGRLGVESLRNPLRMDVERAVGEHVRATVWLLALTAYAAISCPAVRALRHSYRSGTAGQREPSGRDDSHFGDERHIGTSSAPRWASNVAPIGWGGSGSAYVVGHVRTLPYGQEAGDEAIAAAASYGIRLRPGQTFVKPHLRGTIPGGILRFAWTPSASVARAIADRQ